MTSTTTFTPSSKSNPCPICGRTKDGSCSIGSDRVCCHHGSSHAPPKLRVGQTHAGADGLKWAYTGESKDGRCAVFTLDKPRDNPAGHALPAASRNGHHPRPPAPAAAPPPQVAAPQGPIELLKLQGQISAVQIRLDHPPIQLELGGKLVTVTPQALYRYGESQRVARLLPEGGDRKQFLPQCRVGEEWRNGQGPDAWPLWRQEEAVAAATASPGRWVLEAEGEKAAELARQGGLACISQPGHAHKPDQIRPRYMALQAAGVAGIVFLADHDEQGRKRAEQAREAAAKAGLPLRVLPASEVWPGLPAGGSIDDAPGTLAERVAQLVAAASALELLPQGEEEPEDLDGLGRDKRALQAFLRERHTLERDDLLDLPVMDGQPIEARRIRQFDQYLADRYGIDVHPRTAEGALRYLCDSSPFNPIERYLGRVAADVEGPLPTLAEIADAFGFDPEDHVSAEALARHLIGAVKRGLQPGYKHDTMLILSGDQGLLKSEAIAALGEVTGWMDSESTPPKFEEWPFLIRLASCWHFVFDECDRMLRGKHSSEVKGLITRRDDQWARKGEAEKTNHPRRCVMWGTTNEEHGILNDPTGARRFWIAPVSRPCRVGWIRRHRDSIWAAVMHWAAAGRLSYFPPGDPTGQALADRAWMASHESPRAGQLQGALDALPVHDGFPGVAQDELIRRALGIDISRISNRREQMDLVEDVGRTVTAANFTTHEGRWRWKKARARFSGRGNPVAGYKPIPSGPAQGPEPPAAAGGGVTQEPAIPPVLCAGQLGEPHRGSEAADPQSQEGEADCADLCRPVPTPSAQQTHTGAMDLNPCADRAGILGGTHGEEQEAPPEDTPPPSPLRQKLKKVGTVGTPPEIHCAASDLLCRPPRHGVGTGSAQPASNAPACSDPSPAPPPPAPNPPGQGLAPGAAVLVLAPDDTAWEPGWVVVRLTVRSDLGRAVLLRPLEEAAADQPNQQEQGDGIRVESIRRVCLAPAQGPQRPADADVAAADGQGPGAEAGPAPWQDQPHPSEPDQLTPDTTAAGTIDTEPLSSPMTTSGSTIDPAYLPLLHQVWLTNPGAHPFTLALELEQAGGPRLTGPQVKPYLERLRAEGAAQQG